jgi:hypothetical protein
VRTFSGLGLGGLRGGRFCAFSLVSVGLGISRLSGLFIATNHGKNEKESKNQCKNSFHILVLLYKIFLSFWILLI